MRRFTLPELIGRSRQALLSRAEGLPFWNGWLSSLEDRCIADDTGPGAFARVSELLAGGDAAGACIEGGTSNRCRGELFCRHADLALQGRFNLLGVKDLSFGYPIDWHLEPTSGQRSPLVHWKRLDSLDPSITGDKKVVWELNRHQHLVVLARTFLHTNDDRYALEVGNQIACWIRENPPKIGINWVSSLEAAFRCISWLWAIALVSAGSSKSQVVLPYREILRSMHLQGCHIENYLSTYSSPNTHLTGEALGLFYLGACLPGLKRAEQWRSKGKAILLQQLEKHVHPDGVYFEQSSWYHRYTADFYTHFIVLSERAGDPIPKHVGNRLCALLDHLMWITRPDGTSPYLGDDDGGQLVKFEERAPNDWSATLSNGTVLFGRGDYKHVAGEFAEETGWIFGPGARARFENTPSFAPNLLSRAFLDGGYYVMRSGWNRDSNYLLIDCGPHGVMNFGHAHADALSVEVAALGTSFLVDPGTYTYTGSAELRDLFRSSRMHNTLTIDGLSSSEPAGPFKWVHAANSILHCWHDHPKFTFFEGCHDGYKRLTDPATHTRSALFVNREYWVMLDRVDAEDEHEYAVHYHMAPDIRPVLRKELGWLEAHAASASLDIICPVENGTWHVNEGWVSPCYAAKVRAPVGMYTVRKKGALALLSAMVPRASDHGPPRIRNLNIEQGQGFVLSTLQFHDFVLWAGNSAQEEGVHSSDFEWVWVRRASIGHSIEQAVFLHGSQFSAQDLAVHTERPVSFIVISLQDRALSFEIFPSAEIRIRPPEGVTCISVNGKMYPMDFQKELTVSEQDVPDLALPRDENDRCKHVRH